MNKVKVHKGLKKRVKVTATGKVKSGRPFKSHLNSSFSGSRIRKLRRPMTFPGAITKRALRALGEA